MNERDDDRDDIRENHQVEIAVERDMDAELYRVTASVNGRIAAAAPWETLVLAKLRFEKVSAEFQREMDANDQIEIESVYRLSDQN